MTKLSTPPSDPTAYVTWAGNPFKRLLCALRGGHLWKSYPPDYFHDGSSSMTHQCQYCHRTVVT